MLLMLSLQLASGLQTARQLQTYSVCSPPDAGNPCVHTCPTGERRPPNRTIFLHNVHMFLLAHTRVV